MKEEFDKRLSPFYTFIMYKNKFDKPENIYAPVISSSCLLLVIYFIREVRLQNNKKKKKNRVCVGVFVVAEIAPRLPMSLLSE